MIDRFYNGKLKFEFYGHTHTPTLGVKIYNFPKNFKIDTQLLKEDLEKRKSLSIFTTPRREEDIPIFKSGLTSDFITNGDVLEIYFVNKKNIKKFYDDYERYPRPGHSDYVSLLKYNKVEKGSGYFSGRLTILLTTVGSLIKQYLNLKFESKIIQVGTEKRPSHFTTYLEKIKKENDSAGVIINTKLLNLKPGIGDPIFNKLTSKIAYFIFLIPGIKALEFGKGKDSVKLKGSLFNDLLIGDLKYKTNNLGGVSGGISNGNILDIKTTIRPTSSILKNQLFYDLEEKKIVERRIIGMHDVCFGLRVPVVLEAAISIAIYETMNDEGEIL